MARLHCTALPNTRYPTPTSIMACRILRQKSYTALVVVSNLHNSIVLLAA